MKQRTKALLAGVISGAAFAGLVGGLILWLPSYKQKKEMEAGRNDCAYYRGARGHP